MARTRFIPDRGLTVRMATTMVLLALVYAAFVVALLWAGMPWWLVLLVVGGVALVQYFASDRIAMAALGAREVTPQQDPELHAVVDRLCALADMPKPKVAVAHTDVPNAFATGHSRGSTMVCVTTGLRRRLDNVELEAVLAHELSHVAHRDVAVMTVAAFLGIVAGFLVQAGTRFALLTGGGRSREGGPAPAVIALLVVVISAIVWALSFLLTRALSRYRELSADRAAAYLTARPSALSSALVKISGDMARIPTQDLRQVEPFNAFFFAPALSGKGVSLSALLSTHPPTEQRLAQLAEISRQLGRGA